MAQSKPVMLPADIWGSSANAANKQKPNQTKLDSGWVYGEKPPHNEFNWWWELVGQMLVHLQQNGVASWDEDTIYNDGALAHYSTNIWQWTEASSAGNIPGVHAGWVIMLNATEVYDSQLQSDWDITTTTSKAYIKNKPDVSNLHSHSNKAVLDKFDVGDYGGVVQYDGWDLAKLNGVSDENFYVKAGTLDLHAVNLGQLNDASGMPTSHSSWYATNDSGHANYDANINDYVKNDEFSESLIWDNGNTPTVDTVWGKLTTIGDYCNFSMRLTIAYGDIYSTDVGPTLPSLDYSSMIYVDILSLIQNMDNTITSITSDSWAPGSFYPIGSWDASGDENNLDFAPVALADALISSGLNEIQIFLGEIPLIHKGFLGGDEPGTYSSTARITLSGTIKVAR